MDRVCWSALQQCVVSPGSPDTASRYCGPNGDVWRCGGWASVQKNAVGEWCRWFRGSAWRGSVIRQNRRGIEVGVLFKMRAVLDRFWKGLQEKDLRRS